MPRFESPSAIRREHLPLAGRQLRERVILPWSAQELGDHVGIDRGAAAARRARTASRKSSISSDAVLSK